MPELNSEIILHIAYFTINLIMFLWIAELSSMIVGKIITYLKTVFDGIDLKDLAISKKGRR